MFNDNFIKGAHDYATMLLKEGRYSEHTMLVESFSEFVKIERKKHFKAKINGLLTILILVTIIIVLAIILVSLL